MPDVTTIIENDHRAVERLLTVYRSAAALEARDVIVSDIRVRPRTRVAHCTCDCDDR